MKKINLGILTAASVLVLSASAMADNHLGGGFQGPSAVDVVTVEQASKMKDESQVILRGNIESSLGDEKYLFKDKTGSIRVEIDDDELQRDENQISPVVAEPEEDFGDE